LIQVATIALLVMIKTFLAVTAKPSDPPGMEALAHFDYQISNTDFNHT
jgi:hypothetical protein